MFSFKYILSIFTLILLSGINKCTQAQDYLLQGWQTNTEKAIIDLNSLRRGASKDGIPSIDNPKFIPIETAKSWLTPKEPVIAVEVDGVARAYPLQILIWHEIVNDSISGKPILVTFCPLCYSALVFERRVKEEVLEFGVSGFLRYSDLVMYDRETESLWQQVTGKAIVGDYVGTHLEQIPSQIISFKQFRKSYPQGKVLSRNTGYQRNYGRNPYVGYDNINKTPFLFEGETKRLKPMEKVIGVKIEEQTKAYPFSITQKKRVINDRVNKTPIVIFHLKGARSALDASQISNSKKIGSTGVFKRCLNGKLLIFELQLGKVYDKQTGSQWNITGKAVAGPLKGEELKPVQAGDYFAFAWLVFWPETEIYNPALDKKNE